MKPKLLRITTVPVSLKTLLKGQHRFMSQNGFEVVGVSSRGTALQEVHNEEGIRVIELEMTRTFSPFKDLKSLWSLYRLCRKEKPFIVHSHTPKAGIVGMLGAKLAGVPIRLHTVAGMPLMVTSGAKRWVLDIVEKITYGCATKVYPNSEGLYDFIVKGRYAPKRKLGMIAKGSSNGIDTGFFAPNQVTEYQVNQLKKDLAIQPDDFVFVFVGRLVGDKGINELVSAFSRLNDSRTGRTCKLLLVGSLESELDPLLSHTLEAIKNNERIIAVGYQKDVRLYFAISDTLVFPSYREGFPNVVMQAGAMGLPSIVTDINGCNEIITGGVNGLLVALNDVNALTGAMEFLLHNPAEVDRMAKNARPLITERYEQRMVWEAIFEEYKRLLEERTGESFTANITD